MNLTARFTLVFILTSMIVFIIGGIISYEVIQREIKLEEQRFLMSRYNNLMDFLENRWRGTEGFTRNRTIVEQVDMATPLMEPVFSDTLMEHSDLNRLENHVKLDAVVDIKGNRYRIVQYDLIVESDDIIDSVVESLFKTYLILLAAFILIGILISYYMFRPFRELLERIRLFSIKHPDKTSFPESRISEFRKLNRFLEEMTGKIVADYQSLKEFSENASHEMQTPIAIVQGKLDNMLETANLTEDQAKTIVSSQYTLNRLSKLTKSLSLLTKIENREFDAMEEIDLSRLVVSMLDEFEELIALKGIALESNIEPSVSIKADKVLIELLITNLINNAIRHNIESGKVQIQLSGREFVIMNTGNPISLNPSEYFQRFKKHNQSASSTGLGLAIVKRICEYYHMDVSYQTDKEWHILTVKF